MTGRRHLSAAVITALLLLLVPGQVQAHAALAGGNDFYAGLLHPISAFEYVVPLLALGLLAGQQEEQLRVSVPFVCAAAVVAGATLLLLWLPSPTWVQDANTAMALLMGIFVAAAWPPPRLLFLGFAAMLGLGLGYLHGLEMAPGIRPHLFVGGVAVSIVLSLLYCSEIVHRLRRVWAQIGVRVVGSWVVAISALMLGLALR